MFRVPKSSTNLVSIHELNKDLNCKSTNCIFQDQTMRRMIGQAKDREEFYYLKSSSEKSNNVH